jgi:site-specific DNA-cytosine methylase
MVEGEAFSSSILAAQMGTGALAETPIWTDLRTITGPECSAYVRRSLGGRSLDIFFGGIPCQPWSVAGKQAGADDDRDLWPASLEAISHYKPGLVLIENVSGFASEPLGLRRVAADLAGMGYSVASGIFTSSEVGGSHQRKRCFVMGYTDRKGNRGLGTDHGQTARESDKTQISSGTLGNTNGAQCEQARLNGQQHTGS